MAAARRKATTRGGKPSQAGTGKRSGADYAAIQAAKQEAERREHIAADRRRADAKWLAKIPEVRKFSNFEAFKNRFHDVGDRDYAIEVLMAAPNLQAQIRKEQAARRKEEMARNRLKYGMFYGAQAYAYGPPMMGKMGGSDKKFVAPDAGQLQGTNMMRIRINSQAVLGHLTSLLGETERRSTPRTFIRPFKPLIYYQQKMKDILAALEEKWGDVEGLEEEDSETPVEIPDDNEYFDEANIEPPKAAAQSEAAADDSASDDDDEDYDDSDRKSLQSVDSNAEDQEIIMDGCQALRDMRGYVNFVETEVMPLYNQYNDGTSVSKVRYEDLWSLFRVGDLIYIK